MKQILIALVLVVALASCGSNSSTKSDIEVVKVDTTLINQIKNNADSSYITAVGGANRWRIEHYITYADSTLSKIMYDSSNRIKSITRTKAGVPFYTVAYYPNGQQQTSVLTLASITDSVLVKYYYENGRISTQGYLNNSVHVGEWRYYDTAGYMNLIEIYDRFGKLTREQPISFKRD